MIIRLQLVVQGDLPDAARGEVDHRQIDVALAIRLESPGPVFFRQVRVGCLGQTFSMWKFRSMYTDAEERKAALEARNEMQGGVLFKMKADPRITSVGRIIRRLSIDELPQLWNVIKGDMTLVGPRPLPVDEQEPYRLVDSIKTMKIRHAVITSVDRDDLPDGGASHYAACVREIKKRNPATAVEALTPDFNGVMEHVEMVVDGGMVGFG